MMASADLKHPHPELTIDGASFSTLEGFFDEVGLKLFRGHPWGRTLRSFSTALDEMMSEYGPVVVYWNDSEKSREDLGYPETIRYLEARLANAGEAEKEELIFELEAAKRGEGDTLFNRLVEIMREREGLKLELL